MNHPVRQTKPPSGRGAVLFLSCREAARLQREGLEGRLSLPRRLGLRLHLLICGWCRRYGRQIRFLRRAARESAEPASAGSQVTLLPAARERLRRRLITKDP